MRRLPILLVVLMAAASTVPANAGPPPSGTYRGKTIQGLTAIVKVEGRDVVRVDIHVSDNCGKTYPIIAENHRFAIRRGRFHLGTTFPGGMLRIVGRFSGRRVHGSLRAQQGSPGGRTCDTGILSYSAALP